MIFGEENNPSQPPGPQIRLDSSAMETVYANFFALAGAPEEITLYFGVNSPMPGAKDPVMKISHRLLLLPSSAKRLMMALQQTVKAHEDRFGPIEVTPPRPPQTGGA